jgi:hypothetical protein
MTQATKNTKQVQADQRRARLAAELRSNLKKRKQQARASKQIEQPAIEDVGRDQEGRR